MKFERLQDHPPALAEQVANGQFNGAALRWLQEGFARHQAGLAKLDVALGLTGSNRSCLRDDALRQAARILAGIKPVLADDGAWALAGRLAQAWRVFSAGELVRLQRGEQALPLSDLSRALWTAARSGARPRTSKRDLYRLLIDGW